MERYIQRSRLLDRLCCPGSPVVLAAGRVLEDTKQPRLVAQLKFKSVADRPIGAVSGALRCLDGTGRPLGEVPFALPGLAAGRGEAFGQYTAIVLPEMEVRAVELAGLEVRFADGSGWTAPAEAGWDPLPALSPWRRRWGTRSCWSSAAGACPGESTPIRPGPGCGTAPAAA